MSKRFDTFEYRGYTVEYYPPLEGFSKFNWRIVSDDALPRPMDRLQRNPEDSMAEIDFILDIKSQALRDNAWLDFMGEEQGSVFVPAGTSEYSDSGYLRRIYSEPDEYARLWTEAAQS